MSINKESIQNFIIKTISENGHNISKVDVSKEDLNYIDQGYLDSISIINFIIKIEAHFEITIDPKDTHSAQFRTIKGLTNYIHDRVKV